MDDRWYYLSPQGRVGPIPLNTLRTSLALLANPGGVVVWRENSSKWQCAAEMPELQGPASGGIPASAPAKGIAAAAKGGHRYGVAGFIVGVIVILLGCGLFYLRPW
jgi:hypothetical protein